MDVAQAFVIESMHRLTHAPSNNRLQERTVTQEKMSATQGNRTPPASQDGHQVFSQHWATVAERGRPPVLSSQEEAGLVEVFRSRAASGQLVSRVEVLQIASEFATNVGKRDRAKSLSIQWYYNFVKRWPEVKDFFQKSNT